MNQDFCCRTQLSINGQPAVSCMPITAEHALYLNASGAALQEEADVVLRLNGYEELEISNLAEKDVYLERSGRRHHLRTNHPVSIFENDIIHIADTSIRIVESTFVKIVLASSCRPYKSRLGLVSAAACSLAMVCACQSSKAPAALDTAQAPVVQDTAQAPVVQDNAQAPAAAQDGCENYTQKCIDNAPHVCRDHTWKQMTDCRLEWGIVGGCVEKSNTEAVCEVVRTEGEMVYECGSNGALSCKSGNVYVCKNHHWEYSMECGNNTVCAEVDGKAACVKKSSACSDGHCNIPAGKETGICSGGQRMCLNNNIYACIGNKHIATRWVLAEACFAPSHCEQSDGKYVCADAEPCTDGDYSCDGQDIYQCKDKRWVLSDRRCAPGVEYCYKKSNTAVECVPIPLSGEAPPIGDECVDGESKCDSRTGVVICEDGFWKFSEVCGPKSVCKAEGNHASCVKLQTD